MLSEEGCSLQCHMASAEECKASANDIDRSIPAVSISCSRNTLFVTTSRYYCSGLAIVKVGGHHLPKKIKSMLSRRHTPCSCPKPQRLLVPNKPIRRKLPIIAAILYPILLSKVKPYQCSHPLQSSSRRGMLSTQYRSSTRKARDQSAICPASSITPNHLQSETE